MERNPLRKPAPGDEDWTHPLDREYSQHKKSPKWARGALIGGLALLVAVVLTVLAVGFFGSAASDNGNRDRVPDPGVRPIPGPPVETPEEEPVTEPLTVDALMSQAGCEGEVIEPQLYTREVGRCMLDGHELDVAVFASNDQRDEWASFVEELGGTVHKGDLWAVSGFGAAGPESFANAIDV